MTNDEILALVAQYDKCIAGDESASDYHVIDRYDIGDGCSWLQVSYGDVNEWWGAIAVVAYDTGDVFLPTDWCMAPTEAADIVDYDWVHAQTGRRAIIFDGLPRLL